ncbi:hypothetical protein [Pseudalkalibacillus sp. SCS-8]|uniref:hypothetical protein n=1 Tax=Pseudalkalibacillus nanhaiensis TaxID=3115291 RepID=UPI0032DBA259
MLKKFLLMNSVLLFFYHPGIVFGTIVLMSQATSNQEILANLYWIIPQTLLVASVPNILLAAYYFFIRKRDHLLRNFLFAELFVIFIHASMHAMIIALFTVT